MDIWYQFLNNVSMGYIVLRYTYVIYICTLYTAYNTYRYLYFVAMHNF